MKRVEKIPQGRDLPRMPRHASLFCRPRAEAARHFARRGLRNDALGPCRLGARRTGEPSYGDSPDGREHLRRRFLSTAKRLIDLGLGYLTLDRSASTLPAASGSACSSLALRRGATDDRCSLYVLDEQSDPVLHPSANIVGLTGVMTIRRRRQLRHLGRPRHADFEGGRLDRRNGPRSGR